MKKKILDNYIKKNGIWVPKQEQEKRIHHFVSTAYLKQWYVNHNLYSSQFSKRVKKFGKFKSRNHGRICWIEYLYSLNSNNISEKNYLENSFAEEEDIIAPILEKLNNDFSSVTTLEHWILAEFVIRLRVRNPDLMKKQKTKEEREKTRQILKEELFKSGFGFDIANSLSDEYIDNFNLACIANINIRNSKVLRHFVKTKTVYLMDVKKSNYKVLTSNYPVIYDVNLIAKNCVDLVFPLSTNKLLFLIDNEESKKEFIKLTKTKSIDDFVINTNIAILNNHKNLQFSYQVYSQTEDKTKILPPNLIDKYFK